MLSTSIIYGRICEEAEREEGDKTVFYNVEIGLFTFGGGYAMIALLENEFVSKRNWMSDGEFAEMVAIAESTPGPIAINAATYIGYRQKGVFGAVLSTIAVCIPSFAVIYVISLFFNEFLKIAWVAAAFRGIQAGVVVLISLAGIKMFIKMKKSLFNVLVAAATFICMIMFSLFAVDFSSVFYILISAVSGLLIFLVKRMRERKKRSENNDIS